MSLYVRLHDMMYLNPSKWKNVESHVKAALYNVVQDNFDFPHIYVSWSCVYGDLNRKFSSAQFVDVLNFAIPVLEVSLSYTLLSA